MRKVGILTAYHLIPWDSISALTHAKGWAGSELDGMKGTHASKLLMASQEHGL